MPRFGRIWQRREMRERQDSGTTLFDDTLKPSELHSAARISSIWPIFRGRSLEWSSWKNSVALKKDYKYYVLWSLKETAGFPPFLLWSPLVLKTSVQGTMIQNNFLKDDVIFRSKGLAKIPVYWMIKYPRHVNAQIQKAKRKKLPGKKEIRKHKKDQET